MSSSARCSIISVMFVFMNETILNWIAVKEIDGAGPIRISEWRDKYGSPEEI